MGVVGEEAGVKSNAESGRVLQLDPTLPYDPVIDTAILSVAKETYMRNLLHDERIELMKKYQTNCTHVIVREDGQKVYGRLTGEVTEATNLS